MNYSCGSGLRGSWIQKADLKEHVRKAMPEITNQQSEGLGGEADESFKIAVSAIKYLKGPGVNDTIIVTCESVPSIFLFALSETGILSHCETLKLDGNPLDLVVDESTGIFIASIDYVHKLGSTDQLRDSSVECPLPLQTYQVKGSSWAKSSLRFDVAVSNGSDAVEAHTQAKGLSGILYTIEKLRKRGEE